MTNTVECDYAFLSHSSSGDACVDNITTLSENVFFIHQHRHI